ncbi:SPFH domain-containing protein [Candidatus Saccharibacteria bacterium]|jgi:regulator of protease activity HflC (stomatin/prohibitin superfamily)|nr:SPFH domain-containing protein [Candidatus Saccharibacteria bacterium]
MPELIIGIIVLVLILVILPGCRVIRQFERGVVFTLGKYSGIKQPGLRIIFPYFQSIQRVDVRSTPIDVPKQEVITKDNVTVGVDAIVYFRVLDPAKALLETTNYIYATTNFAQAALRDITGNFELDELLSKRDEISAQIKEIVDKETDKWGIDIENVKLQNIELPGDMKRAMAKQAEAERERRAAIIVADGEKASAAAVAEAAHLLAKTPGGLQIRTLQTLEKISSDPSQKTVIVLPNEVKNILK